MIDDLIEEIAGKVHQAAQTGQMYATFHYQVLVHARELKNIDPTEFCKRIRVTPGYAREFGKMLALAKLMNELGVAIAPKR